MNPTFVPIPTPPPPPPVEPPALITSPSLSRTTVHPSPSTAIPVLRNPRALSQSGASTDDDFSPPPSNPLRTASASVGSSVFSHAAQTSPPQPSAPPVTPVFQSLQMPRSMQSIAATPASSATPSSFTLSRSAMAGALKKHHTVSLVEYDHPPRLKSHVPYDVQEIGFFFFLLFSYSLSTP